MKRLTCGQGCESAINWRELARSHPATARDFIISLTKEAMIESFFFVNKYFSSGFFVSHSRTVWLVGFLKFLVNRCWGGQ